MDYHHPDIDPAIAHLDIPICEWRPDCNPLSLWRIKFHLVNDCDRKPMCCEYHAAHHDSDGNRTINMCGVCFETLRQEVAAHVWKLNRFGRAICTACGAPVVAVTDVIRERTKL